MLDYLATPLVMLSNTLWMNVGLNAGSCRHICFPNKSTVSPTSFKLCYLSVEKIKVFP